VRHLAATSLDTQRQCRLSQSVHITNSQLAISFYTFNIVHAFVRVYFSQKFHFVSNIYLINHTHILFVQDLFAHCRQSHIYQIPSAEAGASCKRSYLLLGLSLYIFSLLSLQSESGRVSRWSFSTDCPPNSSRNLRKRGLSPARYPLLSGHFFYCCIRDH
jgi:hypothetical protein